MRCRCNVCSACISCLPSERDVAVCVSCVDVAVWVSCGDVAVVCVSWWLQLFRDGCKPTLSRGSIELLHLFTYFTYFMCDQVQLEGLIAHALLQVKWRRFISYFVTIESVSADEKPYSFLFLTSRSRRAAGWTSHAPQSTAHLQYEPFPRNKHASGGSHRPIRRENEWWVTDDSDESLMTELMSYYTFSSLLQN